MAAPKGFKLATLALLAASLIAGCGGDSNTSPASTAPDPAGAGGAADEADAGAASDAGTASTGPEQIVLATPEDTIQQLWSFYRVENLPGAVSLYDPKVLKVVGKEVLVGAIRTQMRTFSGDEQITSVQGVAGGALVSWQRDVPNRDPILGSYSLRDGGRAGWLIEYDSSLSTAIYTYVRVSEQAKLGQGAEASPKAVAAGQAAQRKYDTAFGAGTGGTGN